MENIKKNEIYEVNIIDNGFKGEGIAKIDDFTVFIPGLIKGEKAKSLAPWFAKSPQKPQKVPLPRSF